MICHKCGFNLQHVITNLPFKVTDESIIIIRGIPVLQCSNCSEYLLEDAVISKVDVMFNRLDDSTELEVLKYPA